jgi:hypothetical protein
MTARALLQDAVDAMRRNAGVVIGFVLAAMGIELAFRLAGIPLAGLVDEDDVPGWARAYEVTLQVAQAAGFSVLTAAAYARLGKDIDRPLWKCASDLEAVRRFFMTWFTLNLIVVLVYRLQFMAFRAENRDLVLLLEFMSMIVFSVLTPAGACIMYHGGLDRAGLGVSLKPITRQFALAFLATFLGFLGYFFLNVVRVLDPMIHTRIILPVLVTIPLALLDALVFCTMWRICMVNRDTPEEDADDLF